MTLKEALHNFQKEYGDIKEKLLFKHLSQKYAKQFFKDHEIEFRDECYARAEELYKKYPPEVEGFMKSPLFKQDGSLDMDEDLDREIL